MIKNFISRAEGYTKKVIFVYQVDFVTFNRYLCELRFHELDSKSRGNTDKTLTQVKNNKQTNKRFY